MNSIVSETSYSSLSLMASVVSVTNQLLSTVTADLLNPIYHCKLQVCYSMLWLLWPTVTTIKLTMMMRVQE